MGAFTFVLKNSGGEWEAKQVREEVLVQTSRRLARFCEALCMRVVDMLILLVF